MNTVQRNFVESLISSGLSAKRQFKALCKFSPNAIVVDQFVGGVAETISLSLERVGNVRKLFVASRVLREGKEEYFIGETEQALV